MAVTTAAAADPRDAIDMLTKSLPVPQPRGGITPEDSGESSASLPTADDDEEGSDIFKGLDDLH